jgi:hypothetical protein
MPEELDAFFDGQPLSGQLFAALEARVQSIGPAELQVSISQVAFKRKTARRLKTFAAAWKPEQYLKRADVAPLVLSVFLSSRDLSPRWKEVVEPYPGRFTHHLELYEAGQLDEEVVEWLRQAWELAG